MGMDMGIESYLDIDTSGTHNISCSTFISGLMLYPKEKPIPGRAKMEKKFLWLPIFHKGYIYWLKEYLITFYVVGGYEYIDGVGATPDPYWAISAISEVT